MINIEMTVREAVSLASDQGISGDLYEKIVRAIEVACGESLMNITLRSMPVDAMIPCIKALRLATGWGLKESKDFCDVVRGKPDWNTNICRGGTPNTLRLKSKAGKKLFNEWKALGCDVVADTWGC